MRETTKEIFENHEVRKTKEQKKRFRDYVTSIAEGEGYKVRVEKAPLGAKNLIVGEPEKADVIYTAHYDTCAFMPLPNFITPKCVPIYILYQLFVTTIVLIIPFLIMFHLSPLLLNKTDSYALYLTSLIGGYVLLWVFIFGMMAGPANKHTANDNTSGVTLLMDIMADMPSDMRDRVAFIFFDLEELGTIGSKGYKMRHPKEAMGKIFINFDCVSDGKNLLFVLKRHSAHLEPVLKSAYAEDGIYSVEVASRGTIYPSDQRNFELGVGVAALKKTRFGLLYMNRIHTPRDTVYDEENIEFLKKGSIELAKLLDK